MTATAVAPRRIELDDVTALGNVDDALGDFYVEQIAAAAATSGVPQRVIREWFEDQLISAQGFRTQVLDGPGDNGPVVLRELEDAHLIRADSRRGAQWYEISHDRLVAPILASNAAWRDRHLSALQVDARAWDRAARPAGLLIGGEVLATAEAWATANPDELLPVDRDYLHACRAAEGQIVAIQRAARRNRTLAIAATALSLVAIVGLLVALLFWRSASKSADEARIARDAARSAEATAVAETANATQANEAEAASNRALKAASSAADAARREAVALGNTANSERLGLIASSLISSDPQLAGLLALEAGRVVSTELSRGALLDAARALSSDFMAPNTSPASVVSPSGHTAIPIVDNMVVVSLDTRLWSRQFGVEATITSMEFNSDGSQLAVAAIDRTIEVVCPCLLNDYIVQSTVHVFDVATGSEVHALPSATGPLEFSPDNRWLLASGARFDLASPDPSGTRVGSSSWEYPIDARFSPDGTTLASYMRLAPSSSFDAIRIEAFPLPSEVIRVGSDDVYEYYGAFELASSNRIAVASGSTIQVRDRPFEQSVCTLDGHAGEVVSLLFSTDGFTLYSAARDATVRSWDLTACRQTSVIPGYLGGDIVFSTDGTAIVMLGQGRTTIVPTLDGLTEAGLRTLVNFKLTRTLTIEEGDQYLIE